jgi:hypothetical protein
MNIASYIHRLTNEYQWWYIHRLTNKCTGVTDVLKKIIPVHYFSLPACRTVHISFDSIFGSALLPPLLPTSSLTPALAHTLCVHPHHQPALSSADRHRPSHHLTPRRHHRPHFWLPLAHLHGLHPHWRPCPARPRHLPPRKPPPPTRF